MNVATFTVLFVILIVFFRSFLEEFGTILQIIKSFFVRKINLKKKYGSWAIITGGTDGIGKAYAIELAKRGINIVLISRNLSKLEAASAEIKKFKVDTKIILADFSKGRLIYNGMEEILEELDIGILVNNVGVQYVYPNYFGELPEDEIWEMLHINIMAAIQMTRMTLPKMALKKRGAIVNISSASKWQPLPFVNLYAASKIFIDYFTDALRTEYKNSNITIQSLCPYYVRTKINHFSSTLMKANIFVPTPERYAKSALGTLGIIDNTTGYWPHRFQFLIVSLAPRWFRKYIGGLMYKNMMRKYLKSRTAVEYF